jgi:cytochrome c oxidase assembly protein subunit 15
MTPRAMLHRFAQFLAACTVLLILAGSLVTSHNAGLSVPDWPTSYGWNMFTFPPSMWVANIFYEHGHRLIASSVGFLTIILAVWLWLAEPRRWLRWLGVGALVVVIAQGILGGLTVLFFLPAPVSTAHAGLAEIFFCMTVAIALFTSPRWTAGYGRSASGAPDGIGIDDVSLRRLATTTTALIYIQILVGATMRHTGAGLAIPDFPLMFGGLLPDRWSGAIAIHFAHRAGALIVTGAIVGVFAYVRSRYADRRELTRPAAVMLALVGVQVTLGALTVLSQRNPWINSFHVVGGALVLTTSLVITLRSWRVRFAESAVRLKADTTTDLPMLCRPEDITSAVRRVRLQADRGPDVQRDTDAARGRA